MEAVAAEWVCKFWSAVAFLAVFTNSCVAVNVRIQYAVVVVVYDLFHIVHTSVTISR